MKSNAALAKSMAEFPFADYFLFGGRPSSAYLEIAENVAANLEPGSSILDFGCGPCDKTAILSHMGYRCTGFDDLNDAWHRQSDNLTLIEQFASASGVDLVVSSDLGDLSGRRFDMVMAHDILEHLHDSPRVMLEALVDRLRPGGLLYVSVPNAVNLRKRLRVATGSTNHPPYDQYYWYPGQWRGHVREYVKSDLDQLSHALGLETLVLRGCDHMLASLSAKPAVQKAWRLATSQLDGLKDSVMLIARKPDRWSPQEAPEGLTEGFLTPHAI